MRIVSHSGDDRVLDLLASHLTAKTKLDLVSPEFSRFAFEALLEELSTAEQVRLLLPSSSSDLHLLGSKADRITRNQMRARWLARQAAEWLKKIEMRAAPEILPQGTIELDDLRPSEKQKIMCGKHHFAALRESGEGAHYRYVKDMAGSVQAAHEVTNEP